MNTNKVLLFLLIGYSCISCTQTVIEEHIQAYAPKTSVDSLKYQQISSENKGLILELDEPTSTVIKMRAFNPSKLIQIRSIGEDKLSFTSYSAKPIYNINVYCQPERVNGLNERFLLFNIDSIPGFGYFEYQPRFTIGESVYKTDKGEYISFYYPYIDMRDLKITIESDDKHYAMLKEIKSDWNFTFTNSDWSGAGENGSWREIRAIYAREWVVIMTNLAYMVAQPEFQKVLDNYKSVFGGDLFGNGGPSDVFTPERYKTFYQSLLNKSNVRLGRTGMGGGLASPSILGIDHWNFYCHYSSKNGWPIIAHEFGHTLGYSHDSNIAADRPASFANIFIPQMHSFFRRRNRLPYTDPDLLKFSDPKNKKYWAQGVDLNLIKPDNKENKVDAFFKSNPLLR